MIERPAVGNKPGDWYSLSPMLDKTKTVLVRVQGRVQGVCYRASTRREATRHGLVGWVKNQPDGSVAALLHGPTEAVDAVVAWCRMGPPMAIVTEVDCRESPPGCFNDFQVLR